MTDPPFWQFVINGLRLATGRGNLAIYKRTLQLMAQSFYVDQPLVPYIEIEPNVSHRPTSARTDWPNVARRLDYRPRLEEICAPTLICAGRFDPQAPLGCSEELAKGIPASRLAVFERNGHYPFSKEPERFRPVVGEFLTGQ